MSVYFFTVGSVCLSIVFLVVVRIVAFVGMTVAIVARRVAVVTRGIAVVARRVAVVTCVWC